MGTNYYIIRQNDNELASRIWSARNVVINNINFVELVEGIIDKQFEEPKKIAIEGGYENMTNSFNSRLHEAVQSLASSIEYDISYAFDLRDCRSIHIGKSSAGWLFNFQDQDVMQDDIHVLWHSYDEVMSFLKEWVEDKKIFVIVDEYDREISYPEFKDFVDTKQADQRNLNNPDNFKYSRNVNGYRFSEGDFS